MPAVRYLIADNDFDVSITLTDAAGSPAVGIPLSAYVSATKERTTEAPIHAEVTATMPDTGADGSSTGVIQGSGITTRLLPTYKNKRVYVIQKSGTDYFRAIPCRVRDGSIY